jgi:hypothetical protein
MVHIQSSVHNPFARRQARLWTSSVLHLPTTLSSASLSCVRREKDADAAATAPGFEELAPGAALGPLAPSRGPPTRLVFTSLEVVRFKPAPFDGSSGGLVALPGGDPLRATGDAGSTVTPPFIPSALSKGSAKLGRGGRSSSDRGSANTG